MKKVLFTALIIMIAAAMAFSSGCAKKDSAETSSGLEPVYDSTGESAVDSDSGMYSEKSEEAPAEAAALEDSAWAESERTESIESDDESSKGSDTVSSPQAGQLTAGSWNDNEYFDYFLELLNDNEWYSYMETWGYEDFTRVGVHVISSDYMPVQNAVVEISDEQQDVVFAAKTDNRGIAYVFPYLFDSDIEHDFTLTVSYQGKVVTQQLNDIDKDQMIDIVLEATAERSNEVDIMFMIDTTGSMSDELTYIQSELTYIIEEVQDANENNLDIRVSTNFYRDTEDEYVCRTFEFTDNINKAIRQINDQYADGGGDYPEAVEKALYEGISNHEWNDKARARIMFLILDAPPHLNSEVLQIVAEQTIEAAKLGIKIIPVASSGVDKSSEFFLRFLDVSTNGTYVFLTNDSGIGNEHIEPTIGQYDVEYLNELLIRLINEEIE
ncbi:MAG: VWA domain-containing protein [Clostridia bacterium]|nr:VWA domain-containing protein [Clostridia bacterium]